MYVTMFPIFFFTSVIEIALWYPIFKFYLECRQSPQHAGVGYNACPQPGSSVYNPQTVPVTSDEKA